MKPSTEPSSGNGSPSLVERLEAATEGSAAFDRSIRDALGLPAMLVPPDGGDEAYPYTTSLDAALTLVPEGWMLDHLGDDAEGDPGKLRIFGATADLSNGTEDAQGQGPTRPLALVIAALKARLGDVG